MKIVVDSNILYSALLSNNNACQFVLYSDKFDFYSPNFMLTEIFKHKEDILKHTKLSDDDLTVQLERILSRISFVKEEIIATNFYYDAFQHCKDLDTDDIPFVALALFLKAQLFTGDKILYKGLKAQGFGVLSLPELIEHMEW